MCASISIKRWANFPREQSTTAFTDCCEYGGSISAEHGIGTHKKAYLGYSRTPQEMALMRTIKQAMDPKNLLNRGKVLVDDRPSPFNSLTCV